MSDYHVLDLCDRCITVGLNVMYRAVISALDRQISH